MQKKIITELCGLRFSFFVIKVLLLIYKNQFKVSLRALANDLQYSPQGILNILNSIETSIKLIKSINPSSISDNGIVLEDPKKIEKVKSFMESKESKTPDNLIGFCDITSMSNDSLKRVIELLLKKVLPNIKEETLKLLFRYQGSSMFNEETKYCEAKKDFEDNRIYYNFFFLLVSGLTYSENICIVSDQTLINDLINFYDSNLELNEEYFGYYRIITYKIKSGKVKNLEDFFYKCFYKKNKFEVRVLKSVTKYLKELRLISRSSIDEFILAVSTSGKDSPISLTGYFHYEYGSLDLSISQAINVLNLLNEKAKKNPKLHISEVIEIITFPEDPLFVTQDKLSNCIKEYAKLINKEGDYKEYYERVIQCIYFKIKYKIERLLPFELKSHEDFLYYKCVEDKTFRNLCIEKELFKVSDFDQVDIPFKLSSVFERVKTPNDYYLIYRDIKIKDSIQVIVKGSATFNLCSINETISKLKSFAYKQKSDCKEGFKIEVPITISGENALLILFSRYRSKSYKEECLTYEDVLKAHKLEVSEDDKSMYFIGNRDISIWIQKNSDDSKIYLFPPYYFTSETFMYLLYKLEELSAGE